MSMMEFFPKAQRRFPVVKANNRLLLILLAVTLPLSLFLGACGGQQAGGPPQMPAAKVPVEQIEQVTVAESSEYIATLISRKSVVLQPQVAGQITGVYVKSGDRVSQGQPLVQIDPARQQATLKSTLATAESKKSEIEQSRKMLATIEAQRQGQLSNLETTESQYNRYNKLYQLKSASLQDVERFQDQYLQAQSNLNANAAQKGAQLAMVASSQRQYEQAQAAAQEQKVQLQYHTISAPFSGFVGDIPIRAGNYVQPLTQLLNITDNQNLEVNISIPSERVSDLSPGLNLEIIDAEKKRIASARISFIAPNVDSQSQTVLVKAILRNIEGKLKADQLVSARIIWRSVPGILIPTTAVTHLGGKDFVYVAQTAPSGKSAPPATNGKRQYIAKQVPIVIDRFEGPNYLVSKGLKPGDYLVTAGIQKLMDGFPLEPQFPKVKARNASQQSSPLKQPAASESR